MTHRLVVLTIFALSLLASLGAPAQGLRISPGVPARAEGVLQADYIVAVVNSEPITHGEVQRESQRLMQQLAQQQRPLPDSQEVSRQVLESLINQKVQLQFAKESGIRVDDAAIDLAVQNIARQNQLNVAELERRVVAGGLSLAQFRTQLRDQLMLTRLREREVDSQVRVSDLEVDRYILEQRNSTDTATHQINLAQILIAVPEGATPEQTAALEAKARSALTRARAGEDFAALVQQFSNAPERANGGQLGLRGSDRYPPLFVDATRHLAVGGISDVLRSPAGFHILKVVEKTNPAMPSAMVTQTRARHILLHVNAQRSEAAARQQLSDFRKRIVSGQANFATLARDFSEDASATKGGDLGWANPGMFVPEFEAALEALAPGDLSEPVLSRFGVHLIQLMERRQAALSERERREMVRAALRDKKLEEMYLSWAQELRGRAYVEMRAPPK